MQDGIDANGLRQQGNRRPGLERQGPSSPAGLVDRAVTS